MSTEKTVKKAEIVSVDANKLFKWLGFNEPVGKEFSEALIVKVNKEAREVKVHVHRGFFLGHALHTKQGKFNRTRACLNLINDLKRAAVEKYDDNSCVIPGNGCFYIKAKGKVEV